MLFASNVFILFFLPLLLACYFLVPSKFIQFRNVILLLFSLVFYAWGSIKYLSLLFISITINYVGGLVVGGNLKDKQRKGLLAINISANLLLLGIFKYLGFGATVLNSMGCSLPVPNIALPIGISFFTFQGLSYVVDVYRKDVNVQKNPIYVALYISLFPQLVAGPIVRYSDIEREITVRKHSILEFSEGLQRFMLGFGKKMILANSMGEIADKIFSYTGTELLTTPVAWVGAIAYTFQIYFDFSAYSDMAIGLGKMFGFHFKENFNYPYISTSVTEFWRRWHISLSSWFRDYVYIPLGGSYCSIKRNIFNLSIVWMLTGMWHGAAWNFILWGIYYGILLILEKYVLNSYLEKVPKLAMYPITMLIVIVGWVFFRSTSMEGAFQFLGTMFGIGSTYAASAEGYILSYLPEWLLCIIAIFPIKIVLEKYFKKNIKKSGYFVVLQVVPKLFAISVFLLAYMKLVSGSFNPFIYFQF